MGGLVCEVNHNLGSIRGMTKLIGPLDPTQPLASNRTLETVHRGAVSAVTDGWVIGGSFFGSIMAGTLLGWLADRWLGADPWGLVIGITVGGCSGFYRMWQVGREPTGKQPLDVI